MPTDDRDQFPDEYDDRPPARRRMTIEQAKARVRGPAIGLILTAAISLVGIVLGVLSFDGLPAQFDAERAKIDENPQLDAAQKQQMKDFMQMYQDAVIKFAPVAWGVAGLTSLLMIAAAVKLMGLSGHGLGVAACIVAMIPCLSGCCVLGLPVGVWGLIVLFNPGVKAAFAANRTAGGQPDVLDPGFDR